MSPAIRGPQRIQPTNWKHYDLWLGVRRAVFACVDRFSTATSIQGHSGADLLTLNVAMSASIEDSMVKALNDLRTVWDPKAEYEAYSFVQQRESFPNIALRQIDNGHSALLGIEMRDWYLFSKEDVPTCVFTVTEAACTEQDLLVVVPWVLSDILAGSPRLFRPFVESALYCARKHNHYWLHERQITGDTGSIKSPTRVSPYPISKFNVSDHPTTDNEGNFGRLAQYGLMDGYISDIQSILLRGIAVRDWQAFFRAHLTEAPISPLHRSQIQ